MTSVAVSRCDCFVMNWIAQDYNQGWTKLLPDEVSESFMVAHTRRKAIQHGENAFQVEKLQLLILTEFLNP